MSEQSPRGLSNLDAAPSVSKTVSDCPQTKLPLKKLFSPKELDNLLEDAGAAGLSVSEYLNLAISFRRGRVK